LLGFVEVAGKKKELARSLGSAIRPSLTITTTGKAKSTK